jgi:hypothetical protein
MVQSNVIEKIKWVAVKMLSKKGKEGESSPALAVTASLGSVGESNGSGDSIFCLWA